MLLGNFPLLYMAKDRKIMWLFGHTELTRNAVRTNFRVQNVAVLEELTVVGALEEGEPAALWDKLL